MIGGQVGIVGHIEIANMLYNYINAASEIGDYENTDSTYRIEGGWVNLGSKREMSDDDAGSDAYKTMP